MAWQVDAAGSITARGWSVSDSGSVGSAGAATSTTLYLGASLGSSFPLDADIYELLMYQAVHGSTEAQDVYDYFESAHGVGYTADTSKSLVLLLGDSRTYGLVATALADQWAQRLATSLGSSVQVVNEGVPGTTSSLIASRDIAASYYNASRPKNVAVVWAGVNNAYADYADYASLCSGLKSAGWRVICCTELFRSGGDSGARSTFNSSVSANFATIGHDLADLAANGTIGDDADAGNASIFPDGLHLSGTGQAEVHDVIVPVVQAELA
jgi:lysophospholipase L1-like esterase